MHTQVITEKRQGFEDANYSKNIDCPEHPGQHLAILYTHGHRYAGIWECAVTGDTDTHEHGDYQTDTIESDTHTVHVYICGGCGVTIEDTDPAIDRDEALAEGMEG
jgi:hypothetical protein